MNDQLSLRRVLMMLPDADYRNAVFCVCRQFRAEYRWVNCSDAFARALEAKNLRLARELWAFGSDLMRFDHAMLSFACRFGCDGFMVAHMYAVVQPNERDLRTLVEVALHNQHYNVVAALPTPPFASDIDALNWAARHDHAVLVLQLITSAQCSEWRQMAGIVRRLTRFATRNRAHFRMMWAVPDFRNEIEGQIGAGTFTILPYCDGLRRTPDDVAWLVELFEFFTPLIAATTTVRLDLFLSRRLADATRNGATALVRVICRLIGTLCDRSTLCNVVASMRLRESVFNKSTSAGECILTVLRFIEKHGFTIGAALSLDVAKYFVAHDNGHYDWRFCDYVAPSTLLTVAVLAQNVALVRTLLQRFRILRYDSNSFASLSTCVSHRSLELLDLILPIQFRIDELQEALRLASAQWTVDAAHRIERRLAHVQQHSEQYKDWS